ncbi:hypothetical protein PHYSODRAFT_473476 [Phytophthora sojae]|uniref:Uncharacterized protein n=1 Tax=Phytophthora sojae (strain P6497) TaxID=1094619 RepID=G4YMR1_PHYSP|nr:hypothetical protein PHYSODRAFT_473476 [Phytophthora sojae]EGZ29258.1 hypothetical protein PHYSODRAFT_473476 [Phytophthora sojae]|eukprot:XP_009516533.1 hypothetical protein PHYSODRAFT_473476 [Phytophthora sojae]
MNSDALSPRHRESPLTRRSRDIPPPTANCLEVQWRFLQHKNPKPPQFGSPQRKTLLVDPISPQTHSARSPRKLLDPAPTRDSPSRLIHMFEVQDAVEAEDSTSATATPSSAQQRNIPGSPCASRTLNDLMGETQRQAMLDRILADMEYLAVEPTYSRLGQPNDDKASSPRNPQRARAHKPSILETALKSDSGGDAALDKKRRQRRKVQQFNHEDDDPRIFWQQTTGARSAADVPERLLTMAPAPPRRMRSAHIVLGRRSHTARQLLASSSVGDNHHRSRTNLSTSTDPAATSSTKPVPSKLSPRRRRRHNLRVPVAASSSTGSNTAPPASPSKAHYGAWYVPQSQWWNLHQLEQHTIVDKLPASAVPATDAEVEPHCHGAGTPPLQRQHKPPLPPAALSPCTNESNLLRIPSASSRSSAAPPSAPGPLDLQVAGIPQSYIGREYRAYVISTGTTIPQYLQ